LEILFDPGLKAGAIIGNLFILTLKGEGYYSRKSIIPKIKDGAAIIKENETNLESFIFNTLKYFTVLKSRTKGSGII
jgi:hypothetical protein